MRDTALLWRKGDIPFLLRRDTLFFNTLPVCPCGCLSVCSCFCPSAALLHVCSRVGSRATSPSSIPSLQLSGSSCCSPTWLSAVFSSWLQGPYITSHTVMIVRSPHPCSVTIYLVEHASPVTWLTQAAADSLTRTQWLICGDLNNMTQVNDSAAVWPQSQIIVVSLPGWAHMSGITLTRVCERTGTCWKTSTLWETASGSLWVASCSKDQR